MPLGGERCDPALLSWQKAGKSRSQGLTNEERRSSCRKTRSPNVGLFQSETEPSLELSKTCSRLPAHYEKGLGKDKKMSLLAWLPKACVATLHFRTSSKPVLGSISKGVTKSNSAACPLGTNR